MTNLNATASHRSETACNRHGPGMVAQIFAVLKHLSGACRSRRDAEHLASLNDYLLKDMGITRNDIDAVVRRGRLPF
ncbi:MAG TPA: DUF1127 domain-containing protein [Sphingomicrobium sp.]|nr:DUF1127 domain-containing protein [Sphingomicrobium sp.]